MSAVALPDMPARPKVILLVDDDPHVVLVLKRQFLRSYYVRSANNAESAMEIVRAHAVDVVVSDMRMPGANGIELLRRVWFERPTVVRVLLTGFSDLKMTTDAIRHGHIDQYVTKPWEPKDLQACIDRALVARRGFRP